MDTRSQAGMSSYVPTFSRLERLAAAGVMMPTCDVLDIFLQVRLAGWLAGFPPGVRSDFHPGVGFYLSPPDV